MIAKANQLCPATATETWAIQVAALAERLRPIGLTVTGPDVHLSVPRQRVRDVLGVLAAFEASDITCTPARLEDLFLRHYEVASR